METWSNTGALGMGYECFAVDPLAPLNDETRSRLEQLRSDLKPVSGLTVLDIGCHAGLASVVSLEMGAKSVLATDVSDEFLNSIAAWSGRKDLPLSVEQASFAELDESHRRDVVLLLEVYHWLAKQGWSAEAVAEKLDLLASQYVVIESPWDATDPSAARRGSEVSADYSLYRLLDSLCGLGFEVAFMGLTTYFPPEYNRARFLCRRGSQVQAPDERFEHGIGSSSPLLTTPDQGFGLLTAVSERRPSGVWPISLPSSLAYSARPHYYTRRIDSPQTLAHEARPLGGDVIDAAWRAVESASVGIWRMGRADPRLELPEWDSLWLALENELVRDVAVHCADCTHSIHRILGEGPSSLRDSLVHGDVHAGNLLLYDGSYYIVDLENLHPGPAFTDIYLFAMLTRGVAGKLPAVSSRLSQVFGRMPLLGEDFKHALAIAFIQHSMSDGLTQQRVGESIHETLSVSIPTLGQ